jgi:ribosomal protein S18 acetylase RimI-like enzyme
MPSPRIRLATPADAYEIAVMSRYLVEVGLRGWSWPPERVTKAIRARSTVVLVGEIHSHLIGFAIAEFGEVQAHLSLLAVKPSHQRCGIGVR